MRQFTGELHTYNLPKSERTLEKKKLRKYRKGTNNWVEADGVDMDGNLVNPRLINCGKDESKNRNS